MKVRELVLGAVLTALGILIPVSFGFLKVIIPPFTATLASHVPVMLAITVSPPVAMIVGLGTGLGFLLHYGATPLGLMIALRAMTHSIWGYFGAVMYKRGRSYISTLAVCAPIHAVLEVIAIYIMVFIFGIPITSGSGVNSANLGLLTLTLILFFGTIAHHIFDSVISIAIARVLKAKR